MSDVKLDDVLVFVEVVDAGGLTAAARRRGLSKSSVSRCLARLEGELGLRLLQRSSRSISLTEAGQRYYESVAGHAKGIVAASAEAGQSKLAGRVRFSAPYDFGAEVLPGLMAGFCELYPAIDLDLRLDASAPRLIEDSLDFAIVGGPQPDSSLVIRKLHGSVFRLYASARYLDKAGHPTGPGDLRGHQAVLFETSQHSAIWRLSGPGPDIECELHARVKSNSLIVTRRAAIAGLGIALLPEAPGELAVRQGQLRPVLPAWSMKTSPLYLMYSSARQVPERVALFRDYLVDHFPSVEGYTQA